MKINQDEMMRLIAELSEVASHNKLGNFNYWSPDTIYIFGRDIAQCIVVTCERNDTAIKKTCHGFAILIGYNSIKDTLEAWAKSCKVLTVVRMIDNVYVAI
jgi:hypothetical protein